MADGRAWLVGKYADVDVVGAANQPVEWSAGEALPPLLASAVSHENLRNAMIVSELEQRFNGVLPIQDLNARIRGAGDREVALQSFLIGGGNLRLAYIHHGKIAVEPVGIALAAGDHGRGIGTRSDT